MDLRVRPQLLSSYIAPIERRGCHRSMRVMRWLSQQLGTLQIRQMDKSSCPMHAGMYKEKSNDVVGLRRNDFDAAVVAHRLGCVLWDGPSPLRPSLVCTADPRRTGRHLSDSAVG